METMNQLRKLNDELIAELESVKKKTNYETVAKMNVQYENLKEDFIHANARIIQLEVLIDELTERIDNLVAECEDLESAEEENKLLRQLLKVVL